MSRDEQVAAQGRLFAPRLGRVGAFLSRLLLTTPAPCYESHGDPEYHRAFAIAWNLYRCRTCAARREPERWWHKLGWKLSAGRFDPFGRTASGRRPW